MATRSRRTGTGGDTLNPAMIHLYDVGRLKKELQQRGLETTGTRNVLADRLQDYILLERSNHTYSPPPQQERSTRRGAKRARNSEEMENDVALVSDQQPAAKVPKYTERTEVEELSFIEESFSLEIASVSPNDLPKMNAEKVVSPYISTVPVKIKLDRKEAKRRQPSSRKSSIMKKRASSKRKQSVEENEAVVSEPEQEYVEPESQNLELPTEVPTIQAKEVKIQPFSEPFVKRLHAPERIASGAERSNVLEDLNVATKCTESRESKVIRGDLRMKIIRSSEGIAQVEMISDGESSIERHRTPGTESSKEVSPEGKNPEQRIRKKPHFADWVYETDIVDDEPLNANSPSTSVKHGVRKTSLDDDWVPEAEVEPEEAIVLEKMKARKRSLVEYPSKMKPRARIKNLLEKHSVLKAGLKKQSVIEKVEHAKSIEASTSETAVSEPKDHIKHEQAKHSEDAATKQKEVTVRKKIPARMQAPVDVLDTIFDKQAQLLSSKYKSEQERFLERQQIELSKRKQISAIPVYTSSPEAVEKRRHTVGFTLPTKSQVHVTDQRSSPSSLYHQHRHHHHHSERGLSLDEQQELAKLPPPPPPPPLLPSPTLSCSTSTSSLDTPNIGERTNSLPGTPFDRPNLSFVGHVSPLQHSTLQSPNLMIPSLDSPRTVEEKASLMSLNPDQIKVIASALQPVFERLGRNVPIPCSSSEADFGSASNACSVSAKNVEAADTTASVNLHNTTEIVTAADTPLIITESPGTMDHVPSAIPPNTVDAISRAVIFDAAEKSVQEEIAEDGQVNSVASDDLDVVVRDVLLDIIAEICDPGSSSWSTALRDCSPSLNEELSQVDASNHRARIDRAASSTPVQALLSLHKAVVNVQKVCDVESYHATCTEPLTNDACISTNSAQALDRDPESTHVQRLDELYDGEENESQDEPADVKPAISLELLRNPRLLLQKANDVLKSIDVREVSGSDIARNEVQIQQIEQMPPESEYEVDDDEDKPLPDFHGEPVPDSDDDILIEGVVRKRAKKVAIDDEEPMPGDEHVEIDFYNADLNIKASETSQDVIDPDNGDGFALMWGGARATYGLQIPADINEIPPLIFQIKVLEFMTVKHLPFEEVDPHDIRIGWSVKNTSNILGESMNSYAFDTLAKKATNNIFTDYGDPCQPNDIITSCLDLGSGTISFWRNEQWFGVAFKDLQLPVGEIIYPHVCTKNCKLSVNFGSSNSEEWIPLVKLQKDEPLAPVNPVFYNTLSRTNLIRGDVPPSSKNECTVLMMVGLPGVGKTTWVRQYLREHPQEQWTLISTDTVLSAMKVNGVSRRRVHQGRWDMVMGLIAKAVSRSLHLACRRRKNYIIDQTNVSKEARRRKLSQFKDFQRKCVVIIPSEDEMLSRQLKQSRSEGAGQLPAEAMLELKAMMSIPNVENEPVEDVFFVEPPLERIGEAIELVNQFNEEARPWYQKKRGRRGESRTYEGRSSNMNRVQRTSAETTSANVNVSIGETTQTNGQLSPVVTRLSDGLCGLSSTSSSTLSWTERKSTATQ